MNELIKRKKPEPDHPARRLADEILLAPRSLPRDLDDWLHTERELPAEQKGPARGIIVIATHGHSRFERAWLGSTAEKMVRHAPCPVLVVRGKEVFSDPNPRRRDQQ